MGDWLAGYDIGGTKCAAVLGRPAGDRIVIVDRVQFATVDRPGSDAALRCLEDGLRRLLERQGLATGCLRAIGVSCGGPLDSRRGVILSPPNLPGWDGVPVTARVEAAFGVPARLQNDANACALAEWKWGAGRGTRNMVFLTFGTGLGAGLILDGRLYAGTNDLAGEAGHVRLAEDGPEGYGKRGSFEGFCSGVGIARLAAESAARHWSEGRSVAFCDGPADLGRIDARRVAEAARAGDHAAREVYRIAGHYLGRGLAMLIDLLNPEVIVIGSLFVRQRDLLWSAAAETLAREALPGAANVCRVLPAALGEQVGDYASLSLADV